MHIILHVFLNAVLSIIYVKQCTCVAYNWYIISSLSTKLVKYHLNIVSNFTIIRIIIYIYIYIYIYVLTTHIRCSDEMLYYKLYTQIMWISVIILKLLVYMHAVTTWYEFPHSFQYYHTISHIYTTLQRLLHFLLIVLAVSVDHALYVSL